uniref:Uncharacterized protein n=1 Tax=Parascaris equorum TaxID=6256 RepID=A0A914RHB3_PAREQ
MASIFRLCSTVVRFKKYFLRKRHKRSGNVLRESGSYRSFSAKTIVF